MSEKMHNYKRPKTISRGSKSLAVALVSSLCMLSTSYATGLGRLTVLSALGQPLRAEIELTSPNKEEVSALVPKLASPEAFKQANIDFNAALLTLRFAVEQRGARYVIRVSSTQPINEPFVDLLLEMNSSSGRLFREYTFLLDPAELRTSQSAQIANPVSVATNTEVTTSSLPTNANAGTTSSATNNRKNTSKSNPVAQDKEEAKNTSDKVYEVKRGDTLSKVANAYRQDGVSLDQMLVSLYKANPEAFDRNNMNRLKAGRILNIPDSNTSQSVSKGEAHAVVLAHAADFNSYRNKLAAQVEEAPAAKTRQAKQSVGGSITAKVNEAANPTSEAVDRLKLSKAAGDAANTSSKSGTGKNQAEEDKIAREKAVAEANARVKELEKNVSELQKILELKNKDLAGKQTAAEAKPAEVKPTEVKSVELPKPEASSSTVAASAPAVASTPVETKPAVQPPVKRKVTPPPPPPETSFLDSVLDIVGGSMAVIWGALAIALIAIFGIVQNRRKKKLQKFDDSMLTGSSMKANSMFGSTGGQSVDTNNSVFNSNFAPSASQLDANEVDPVAEADVYIAYGRDSQAEEILKEALRTQPDRHAVRVKLLEIYHSRKDPRSFERLASELYGMTNGAGEEWQQAASMGMSLEPNNPLYAGGKPMEAPGSVGMGMSTQPLEDLDSDALLDGGLSEDMLDSISIIDTAAGMADEMPAPVIDETMAKEEPKVEQHEAASFDIGALDFDLGLEDASADNAVESNAPMMLDEETSKEHEVAPLGLVEESAEPEHQENEIDFHSIDFDLGDEVDKVDESAAPALNVEMPEPKPMDASAHDELMMPSMDFPLEQVETKKTTSDESAPDLTMESADLMESMDLRLPEDPSTPTHTSKVDGLVEPAMPAMSLDMMPEHMDVKLEEEPVAEMPSVTDDQEMSPDVERGAASEHMAANFDFDLSGIDLNLDSPATEASTNGAEVAAAEEPQAFNAEMATKLDLAVAYHEIGDKEGARELLDEVIKGGSADQVERARTMLAQLA